ncbi:MAG: hypothetical protein FJX75_03490 [Armatimonadetes bacterium]|nr:hypothetical protein [Armatimonadota bacterium]
MCRRIAVGVLIVATALVVGCKKRAVDTKAEEASAQEALAATQAEQGKTLQQIQADVVTVRNTAAAQAAEPAFKDDLAVGKRLTSELSKQASKQQDKEAAVTIDRLTRCLVALVASAPANRIQQHLERAEMGLSAGNLEAAGGEVLAAAGTAYNPSAPALVPDVLSKLEEASQALRAGDATKAAELLGAVMEKTRSDATAADLASAHEIAVEAEVSVARKAWPILIAQATQVNALLDSVAKRATPEAKVETAPPAPTTEKTTGGSGAAPPEAGATKTTEAPPPSSGAAPATGAPKSGTTQPEPSTSR